MHSQNFQDWNVVTWDKKGKQRAGETKEQQIQRLKRNDSSLVTTQSKITKLNQTGITTSSSTLRKIEKEEETFKLPTVSKSMANKIAKARCEKKLSQKDLAMKLNLPFKIIKDYESAVAIPNHIIINKLEGILETRLRD